jgi:hypothetical protein
MVLQGVRFDAQINFNLYAHDTSNLDTFTLDYTVDTVRITMAGVSLPRNEPASVRLSTGGRTTYRVIVGADGVFRMPVLNPAKVHHNIPTINFIVSTRY